MITTLPDRIAALPDDARQACQQIFHVATATGYADPPPPMYAWVERHFGSVAAVREQTIVRVVNKLTLEAALFNPLRARRPLGSSGGDSALETRIGAALAGSDIFRDPERDTTADLFGRLRGQFCVTASNAAKCEGWHGLVIFDEPHPLRFDQARLRDYLDTALRWLAAAHAHDPAAIYPLIVWNCLPKSGATQMHGHMQLLLGRGMPYARPELWRRAAQTYRASYGVGYFGHLFATHRALGLALPRDDVRAFAHLTPLRNREVVILADGWWGGQRDKDTRIQGDLHVDGFSLSPDLLVSLSQKIADPLYAILRNLIDVQGVRAFNLGIAFPPLRADGADWDDAPIIVRAADRGDPLATSGDLGAIELYATGCITADPFEVAAALQNDDRG
jgi:hypothetical protein